MAVAVPAEQFAIACEMGLTLEQISAHYLVSAAELDKLAIANWGESAENASRRLRASGPVHLMIKAYERAQTDARLLTYLLDRLWVPRAAGEEQTAASSLTDAQLVQIHSIIKGTMT